MKKMVARLLCLICLIQPLAAQTLDEQLQDIYSQFDLAGMSVAVIKDKQVVFSKGYGLANIAGNVPAADSTVYRIASVSKMVTAIGFMQLYEQGLVGLDQNISEILGFPVVNPYFPAQGITPRMLLSHTSSLTDGAPYDNFLTATYNQTPPPPVYQLLTDTGAYYQTVLFSNKEPGTWFQYANINYGILGTLIEKLSAQRFDQYMRQHVLEPLGINTGYNVYNLPNAQNLAALYRKQGGNWVPQADNYNGVLPAEPDMSGYVIGSNGLRYAPQGGLRISATDMAKINIMLLNNGNFNGTSLLEEATALLMKTVQWTFNGTNGNNYYNLFNSWGLGLQRTTNTADADIVCPGVPMWGHAGEAYGLVSDSYFSDDDETGIVFITNGCGVGYTTPANSAYYEVEAEVFNAVCTQLPFLEVTPPVGIVPDAAQNNNSTKLTVQHLPNGWQVSNLSAQPVLAVLLDLNGKTAGSFTLAHGSTQIMNNKELPEGIYLLNLKAAEQITCVKLVKF